VSPPPSTRPLDPDARAELEDQRDFLLRSLDDLERERAAGDLDDADYRVLHDDYTARAAEVLRAIEAGRLPGATGGRVAVRRGRRLVAWALVGTIAVSAGLAVAGASGSRLPGETISGEIRQTTSGRLQQAAELAQGGKVTEALVVYDEVLVAEPDNVEALSERGLLLVSLGAATGRPALGEQGAASIEQALALDPGNPRGLFYRGLAQRLAGDDEAAAASFGAALAGDPPPVLRQQIESFLTTTEAPAPG
jgi:tetratricopeptide (TPR) repeat protein